MAQSNLRAPQCEALVLAARRRLFQERERLHHRYDWPGRHAYDDQKAERFRQVIAFHLCGEKFVAKITEGGCRRLAAIVPGPEIAAGLLVVEIGNRAGGTQSDRHFFATMRFKL